MTVIRQNLSYLLYEAMNDVSFTVMRITNFILSTFIFKLHYYYSLRITVPCIHLLRIHSLAKLITLQIPDCANSDVTVLCILVTIQHTDGCV